MLARVKMLWVHARDSLWFLPALFTIVAAALALALIEIEKRYADFIENLPRWLWDGGAEGARGVLSTIAGSLVTVTGVVFSVTIVALQLASSQFTPRLLRNFTADRTNQTVLGVFIGTFTYCLLVLRAVRSEGPEDPAFVPRLAATLAVGLSLVSIGFLIYFIDHASKSIQLSVIIDRVTRQTSEHVKLLLPEIPPGEEATAPQWEEPAGEPGAVLSEKSGYLQAVDEGTLIGLAREREIWIRMEPHVGQFMLEGLPLVSVWPAPAVDEEVESAVRLAFVLGHEPTPEQDVEFGVIEISDIAVKALSPGINDPTTAIRCIDRLGEILVAIGRRRPSPPAAHPQDPVRFLAKPLDYERVVGLALDQIRHFGADNPTIGRKLIDLLMQMKEVVPPDRHGPLRSQLLAVVEETRHAIRSPVELADFERMLARYGLTG